MRRIVLILIGVLGVYTLGFGQIKVNSSGRAFFGSGTGTTSYGTINLTVDGTTNGISFTGTSTNRYGIFKYNNELYMTPSNGYTSGLKVSSYGGVFIATGGLSSASGSAALTVSSTSGSALTAVGPINVGSTDIIKAIANRNDSYAFVVQNKAEGSRPFYVKSDGTVYSKIGYLQSSDLSKKEDLKPLEKSLDKISALSPVSFYYKDFVEQTLSSLSQISFEDNIENDSISGGFKIEPDVVNQLKKEATRKRIGLIAQEVEEVVPEVVRTLDDGTKGIMYSDLVSLLIEGIKELKVVVDDQKEVVDGQKEIIENQVQYIQELEERVTVLESSVLKEKQFAESVTNISDIKSDSKLYQNTPNPFSQETEIKYIISDNVKGYIAIYDLNGRQLKKYVLDEKSQGHILISASELSPGIYLYSLIVEGQEVDTKRMILTD